jgi:hypothetical protein
MSENDPNEFTDREKFILSYYRDSELSGSRRLFGYDVVTTVASVACIIAAAIREELALAVVGYILVVGRMCYTISEGGRWTRDFQSIFRKYDAKLKAQKMEKRDDVV